jgi:putative ubiquitin-RnfH superfamily antitoxin RatB of RatAB toxin-antitoxin module
VYGERCDARRVLREDDRVELYRPLVFDPLESRRRRAAHRQDAAQRPARSGAPRA